MHDETACLASDLAIACGRSDWWNFYADHTRYEWAHQVAMHAANPHGPDRDDLRAAWLALHQMIQAAAEKPPNEAIQRCHKTLLRYLKRHEIADVADGEVSIDAIAKLI